MSNDDLNRLAITPDLGADDCARLSHSKAIAIDCEMAGLNPYRDPLYLVQICDQNGQVNLVRAKDWHAAPSLGRVLADPGIMKVFHFAIMDCAFFLTQMGLTVENAYCTKIASKIARTYAPSHSLSSLWQEFLNLELNKSKQTVFWGAEPLSDDHLAYAVKDVINLLHIKQCLEDILAAKGKLPTGISYQDLNDRCQKFIPTLVQIWVNGWDFGKEDTLSLFGR